MEYSSLDNFENSAYNHKQFQPIHEKNCVKSTRAAYKSTHSYARHLNYNTHTASKIHITLFKSRIPPRISKYFAF